MDAIYAAAVAAAGLGKLLSAEKFNRMIECASAAEAMRVLAESAYGGGLADADEAETAELAALNETVRASAPSRAVKSYLLADCDFHNAEALLRAKKAGIPAERMLLPAGETELSALREAVAKGDYAFLPEALRRAAERAEEILAADGGGFALSVLFTRALYAHLTEETKGHAFLRDALTFRIDATNLLVCLRAENYPLAAEMLLEGGTLTEGLLRDTCAGAAALEALSATRYRDFARAAAEADAQNAPYTEAERIAERYALDRLSERRLELDGDLPFLFYALAKKSEIADVRTVLSGLRAGLSKQQIRARMRGSYEG